MAHSSQMVFITGEDVAVQQGFVEAFLGQQSQHANVALVNARKGKSDNYYRQLLAEQLQCSWQRNQSLVQSFAARDNKTEPVLIAITSAENVPEDVLRELWDLVLQNRFARNGEQINILMFGDHFWAEDVKSWLPTNNNDKPVLLTTQTLEYDEETEVEGDLDEMIANRRKLFQERMKHRASRPALGTAPLQKWWVKLALAMVFVGSFSSILIWQYFDVTSAAVSEFSQFLFQSKPDTQQNASSDSSESSGLSLEAAVALANQQSNEEAREESAVNSSDNQRVAANFSDAMQRLDNNESVVNSRADDNKAIEEAVAAPVVVNTFSKQSADSPSSEYIADISAEQLKQLRDTGTLPAQRDTQSGSRSDNAAKSDNEQASALTASEAQLNASVMDALVALELLNSDGGVNDNASTPRDDNASTPRDSANPPSDNADTASVNRRIDETAAQESAVNSANPAAQNVTVQENQTQGEVADSSATVSRNASLLSGTQSPDSAAETQNQAVNTDVNVNDYPVEDIASFEPIESGTQNNSDISSPRYQYHEPLLLELADSEYVLQVSGISTETLLQEFLVDNQLLNDVWVYQTQRYGGDWFVVLVKQNYASLDVARAAAASLPDKFSTTAPFAKSVAQIRREITVN
ncbi:SPOR domain-containing protein [Planctobacterium marinum]|uniref:SPOR domain-containing protein n=1 Tax=Planctobacterium marinum TaxID=1631968 RepID=UPI001E42865C|nr:hypothetical protein [Planctobacterium marinum]MCC2607626.1 hypothetical protein [Planctobacterium marinum]